MERLPDRPPDVGTYSVQRLVKRVARPYLPDKLFVSLGELRDHFHDSRAALDDVDRLVARLPPSRQPIRCSMSDDEIFFKETARFRGYTEDLVLADDVRSQFPHLQVGDLERDVYYIQRTACEWTTWSVAETVAPELFPFGRERTKLRSDEKAFAARSETGVWNKCGEDDAGSELFVKRQAVRSRLNVREHGAPDPSGDMVFTAAECKALLDLDESTKIRKRDALRRLKDRGSITNAEYDASMPQAMKTDKCYLYSQVLDERSRDALDRLVIVGSKMLEAASIVVNHIVIEQPTVPFSVLVDQTFAKYLVFPWKGGEVPEPIATVLERHPHLARIYPTRDEVDALLDTSAIDQFVQLQGCKLSANCKGHVISNLVDRTKAFCVDLMTQHGFRVRKHHFDSAEGRRYTKSFVWEWIVGGGPEPANLPPAFVAAVNALTDVWGGGQLKDDPGYATAFEIHVRVTPRLNQLPRRKRSPLPKFGIDRQHVRLDARVLEGLCSKAGIAYTSLRDFLNLDRMREWRKDVRKHIRATRGPQARGARSGYGSWSDNILDANIRPTSFETDGVALSICLSWNCEEAIEEARKLPLLGKEVFNTFDEEALSKTAMVGGDPGRVQPITDAYIDQSSNADATDFSSHRLNRAQYHRQSLTDRHTLSRAEYMASRPDLAAAYGGMAELTWKTFDSDALRRATLNYLDHKDLHDAERVSKRNALWKMLIWRRKTSYMDRHANEMVKRWYASKPGAERLIVFYGNGSFAPTGRREKAVPTKAWLERLLKAMKRNAIAGGILMTGEAYTTQMCHKCHGLTAPMEDEERGDHRDLRCCTGACAADFPNNCRGLNRDRNAAINIYKAGLAYIKGEDRPGYLTKAWKEECLRMLAAANRPHQR